MSRQILFLNDERTRSHVIQLQIMFNTLMGKNLPLKVKVRAGKMVQLHADNLLNLNISKSRINFKSTGAFNTNKKIELYANQIKKHQLSLLNCGGSSEFEVDDFFKQQFSDVHNNDEFRKRKGKQQAQYNKEFYEMKFFRSNTVSYPVLNIAKGMAKYVYASFLKEKTEPLLEDAVDLTEKSVIVGTAVIGGSQAVAAYQALSIPTRVLIGGHIANGAVGGLSSYSGAVVTGDDHPYRSAVIGIIYATLFGLKSTPSLNSSIRLGPSTVFGKIGDEILNEKSH